MKTKKVSFIRYPGGKQRILNYIIPFLPSSEMIKGRFIEPFLGSGAIFFALNPERAFLTDMNRELIDLYRGIRRSPLKVWEIYKSFPKTKKAYYEIRAIKPAGRDLTFKAARTLYLNRTCFKGMWRHNSNGEFNVGYGGEDRRWVINQTVLKDVSDRLKNAILKCSDFEEVIDESKKGDFIFADPPYKPGERELLHSHYVYGKFGYSEYQRLERALKRASNRGVKWAITISSHPDILDLFGGNNIVPVLRGTGEKPGILTNNSGEVIIRNYKERLQ
ncbi:MAG TPA: Dam family site-specific DNA-(adenine-N6)-methyltransferase [Atribacter sp.]|uniref:DNA adenine methylase n=1 Tax=Atribacter sp. TaxID=2847780 RepID=UPI002CA39E5C|nr:Dam family site-specific DNA-(adenine-N6)-methyltransferase [Atribacter sp.]HQK83942.1 Dam family site-specific DNA-(adenine-N6)-methyltransferase [Atribacter sp.]